MSEPAIEAIDPLDTSFNKSNPPSEKVPPIQIKNKADGAEAEVDESQETRPIYTAWSVEKGDHHVRSRRVRKPSEKMREAFWTAEVVEGSLFGEVGW